ncbi:MAG TPA: hypothetical protein VMV94_17125 [Phycisphaerae bacterium]|nr:hypothetical protein [Phycisphaerae bacterium]
MTLTAGRALAAVVLTGNRRRGDNLSQTECLIGTTTAVPWLFDTL